MTSEYSPRPAVPQRSASKSLVVVLLLGIVLSVPLFSVWLLIFDRQNQSETARSSIVEGWGGEQVFAGPKIVLPYQTSVTETVIENEKTVTKTNVVTRELFIAPQAFVGESKLPTQIKQRAIYKVAVYRTRLIGEAEFVLPSDIERLGIHRDQIDFDRAELRFGLSDSRGLSGDNRVKVGNTSLVLQPGKGLPETQGSGFHASFDGADLSAGSLKITFDIGFKGSQSIALYPHAGQTSWTVSSTWPHPSFAGGFLPEQRVLRKDGFRAHYEISHLAVGTALVTTSPSDDGYHLIENRAATVRLIQPLDLYDQVSRSAKYGFLIIGFTLVAFLLFDIIGGIRISAAQYLLIGGALILFFILLLAFAEVVGFSVAYSVASTAIIGLITTYAAAALKRWRRALYVGTMLVGLYGAIYVLLSLEAYSLIIGSLVLFIALATVMYLTRNLDWSAKTKEAA